jgi:hypothetical protein
MRHPGHTPRWLAPPKRHRGAACSSPRALSKRSQSRAAACGVVVAGTRGRTGPPRATHSPASRPAPGPPPPPAAPLRRPSSPAGSGRLPAWCACPGPHILSLWPVKGRVRWRHGGQPERHGGAAAHLGVEPPRTLYVEGLEPCRGRLPRRGRHISRRVRAVGARFAVAAGARTLRSRIGSYARAGER